MAGLSETPHDDGALSAPNDRLAVAPSTQDFVHKAVRGEDGPGPSEDFKRIEALVDGGKVKATLPTALDSQHQKMLDELKAIRWGGAPSGLRPHHLSTRLEASMGRHERLSERG